MRWSAPFSTLRSRVGLLPSCREETDQRAAARDLFFGKFVVKRGRHSFLSDSVDNVRRDHNDPVAVADDDVTRVDGDTAASDRQVEIGRLMDNAAWWR